MPVKSRNAVTFGFDNVEGAAQADNERLNTIGKVSDLKLDAELQKKSESRERAQE